MNYLHTYHAGNFADVFKHSLLLLLLNALRRKDTPFAFLDSHAGFGYYDLLSADAQRTQEYRQGAELIFPLTDALPLGLAEYQAQLRADNPNGVLQHYRGSSAWAASVARTQDRLVLVESQTEIVHALKTTYARDERIAVHQRDAYEALKGLLPLPQKRGLVLIDPPFEAQEREFEQLLPALLGAAKRWASSIALWYPIKHEYPVETFLRRVQSSGLRDICVAELRVLPCDNRIQLNGCGLLVLRPPWQFAEQAETLVNLLQTVLGRSPAASSRVFSLVRE